jgi:pilus assembly protein Flp/PilA
VTRLAAETGGATAIEYALIAGMVSIVILTAVSNVGTQVLGLFIKVVNAMP